MSTEKGPPLRTLFWNRKHGFYYSERFNMFVRVRILNDDHGGPDFSANIDVLPYDMAAEPHLIGRAGEVFSWWKNPPGQDIVGTLLLKEKLQFDIAQSFLVKGDRITSSIDQSVKAK